MRNIKFYSFTIVFVVLLILFLYVNLKNNNIKENFLPTLVQLDELRYSIDNKLKTNNIVDKVVIDNNVNLYENTNIELPKTTDKNYIKNRCINTNDAFDHKSEKYFYNDPVTLDPLACQYCTCSDDDSKNWQYYTGYIPHDCKTCGKLKCPNFDDNDNIAMHIYHKYNIGKGSPTMDCDYCPMGYKKIKMLSEDDKYGMEYSYNVCVPSENDYPNFDINSGTTECSYKKNGKCDIGHPYLNTIKYNNEPGMGECYICTDDDTFDREKGCVDFNSTDLSSNLTSFINALNKDLEIDEYSALDTLIISDNTNNEFFKFKYPNKEIDEFMVYDDLLNIDEKYLQYYLIVGDSSYSLFPYLYNRVRYVNKNENSDVRETITLDDNDDTSSESSAIEFKPGEETLIENASDYNKKIILDQTDRLELYSILQMILAGTCEKISNLRHDKNIKTYLDCTNINDFDEKIYSVEGNEAKLNNEKQEYELDDDVLVNLNDDKETINLMNAPLHLKSIIEQISYQLENCEECNVDRKEMNMDEPYEYGDEDSYCNVENLYCPGIKDNENTKMICDAVFKKTKKKCNMTSVLSFIVKQFMSEIGNELCKKSCGNCKLDDIEFIGDKDYNVNMMSGINVMVSERGFRTYTNSLKFNILDSMNLYGIRQNILTDNIDNSYSYMNEYCVKDIMEDGAPTLFTGNNLCYLAQGGDKLKKDIPEKYKSDKNMLFPGMYAYCPDEIPLVKSIKSKCAKGELKHNICKEVDNSNTFLFKLNDTMKCFGEYDYLQSVILEEKKVEEEKVEEKKVEEENTKTNPLHLCIAKSIYDSCDGYKDFYMENNLECNNTYKHCLCINKCAPNQYYDGYDNYKSLCNYEDTSDYYNIRIDPNKVENSKCKKCVDEAVNCVSNNAWDKKLKTYNDTKEYKDFISKKYTASELLDYDHFKNGSEIEHTWYIKNWDDGIKDENEHCKGKWVYGISNSGNDCNDKECILKEMTLSFTVSEDLHIKDVEPFKNDIITAMYDFLYQLNVGTKHHIVNSLYSKIFYLTKNKGDPTPECGLRYNDNIFTEVNMLISHVKKNNYGIAIPLSIRNRIKIALSNIIKQENKNKSTECYLEGIYYKSEYTKLSTTDIIYLTSLQPYIYYTFNDIKKNLNNKYPDDVSIGLEFKEENNKGVIMEFVFKNIKKSFINNLRNNFQSDTHKEEYLSTDMFSTYLFKHYNKYKTYRYVKIFEGINSINFKQQIITLKTDNKTQGYKSNEYVWLYEKEKPNALIECIKDRGFIGEFSDIKIEIEPGMTYNGMETCSKNNALWFKKEQKCDLKHYESKRIFYCEDECV